MSLCNVVLTADLDRDVDHTPHLVLAHDLPRGVLPLHQHCHQLRYLHGEIFVTSIFMLPPPIVRVPAEAAPASICNSDNDTNTGDLTCPRCPATARSGPRRTPGYPHSLAGWSSRT